MLFKHNQTCLFFHGLLWKLIELCNWTIIEANTLNECEKNETKKINCRFEPWSFPFVCTPAGRWTWSRTHWECPYRERLFWEVTMFLVVFFLLLLLELLLFIILARLFQNRIWEYFCMKAATRSNHSRHRLARFHTSMKSNQIGIASRQIHYTYSTLPFNASYMSYFIH